mmetsp:Transcript_21740/g.39667  ORF Transcript_21740/g.39667 Transcript_21740/m.39667 type:complete len:204 (-) Transcript_21740:193-804(-)
MLRCLLSRRRSGSSLSPPNSTAPAAATAAAAPAATPLLLRLPFPLPSSSIVVIVVATVDTGAKVRLASPAASGVGVVIGAGGQNGCCLPLRLGFFKLPPRARREATNNAASSTFHHNPSSCSNFAADTFQLCDVPASAFLCQPSFLSLPLLGKQINLAAAAPATGFRFLLKRGRTAANTLAANALAADSAGDAPDAVAVSIVT